MLDSLRRFCGARFLPLFLGLLLAFAQLGALTHEIGHLAGDARQEQGSGKYSPPGDGCEQCLAYGQIGGAIGNSLPATQITPAHVAAVPAADTPLLAAAAPAQRSRGPPIVL